ncbi:MAG: hypothetical protein AAGA43_01015 [Bacteroidota bacterium]
MKQKPQNLNSRKFFNILYLNHSIFILVMIAFGAFHFVFFQSKIGSSDFLNLNNQASYFTLSIFILFVFLGYFLYSKNIERIKNLHKNEYVLQKKISEKNQLILKMGNYRSAILIKLFFVFVPIAATPWLIETSAAYFLGLILSVVYCIAILPTKKRAIRTMELKDSETQRINNPKAVIARRTFSLGIGNNNNPHWRY